MAAPIKAAHGVIYARKVEEEGGDHLLADRATILSPGKLFNYGDAPISADQEYSLVGWIVVRSGIGSHALSSDECHIQKAGQAQLEYFFCVIVNEGAEGKYSCVRLNPWGMQIISEFNYPGKGVNKNHNHSVGFN
jgi:hypothetical protein